MGRVRPPDHVPRAILQRPEFIDACERRDLGTLFSLIMRWGGPGWTASHIGRRCALGLSQIADYRSGRRRATSVEVWERVADGLHIPGQLLQLGERPWESEDDPVDRRAFMRVGTGVAAVGLTGSAPQPTQTTGAPLVSGQSKLERDIARLRRLDARVSGRELYDLYSPLVDQIRTAISAGSSPATRTRLLQLYAEHAQQTGWAAFDAGMHQEAARLYKNSWQAARDIANQELAANALALRAYQKVSTGHDGVELTQRSLAMAEQGARPAVLALLYQRGSWTMAVAGKADETERLLGLAADVLDPEADGPGWATWANTEVEQQIMTGRCWTHLRRPLRAVPALETAVAAYSDELVRDKALYLSWLAESYIDAAEPELAANVANRSLQFADASGSARPRQRIGTVLERLSTYRQVPAVRDLLARRPLHPTDVHL